MDRRRFLATTTAAVAIVRPSHLFAQSSDAAATVTLTLQAEAPGSKVPSNFVGLSYETQQLSQPDFFSAKNNGLIQQFRELAPHGVLRLGGNTSDYGFWKPTPESTAPPRKARPYKAGDPPPDLAYAVTPEAVHNLRAFLDATGWTCLYGINLGTNTPELAAAEAEFVAKALGGKLEYFQVGNEADRFGSTIRDAKTWSADTYLDEWLVFAKAILERVPQARFGMPDIASNEHWFATIGERLSADPIRSHIECLTHHYYIGGPPSNPAMTVEKILTPDPRVTRVAEIVRAAAEKLHTSWRMTEGNTCYRGGKPGVSDVFAAALWSADYMLTLATLGYAGVNLHGGDPQMVANSLGGRLPGDEMVKDDPANHPRPYYTPIAHIGASYVAEPVSYGMRVAQHFAGAQMIPLEFDPGTIQATAYAAKRTDAASRTSPMIFAVINKDAEQALHLQFPGTATLLELTTAESLTSREVQVRKPRAAAAIRATVPPHSIAIFTLSPTAGIVKS